MIATNATARVVSQDSQHASQNAQATSQNAQHVTPHHLGSMEMSPVSHAHGGQISHANTKLTMSPSEGQDISSTMVWPKGSLVRGRIRLQQPACALMAMIFVVVTFCYTTLLYPLKTSILH